MPSKFSMPRPMGSRRLWQAAHVGLAARWARSRARTFSSCVASSVDAVGELSSGGMPLGGEGTASPSRKSRTHLPRNVGTVRYEYDVCAKNPPRPKNPMRFGSMFMTLVIVVCVAGMFLVAAAAAAELVAYSWALTPLTKLMGGVKNCVHGSPSVKNSLKYICCSWMYACRRASLQDGNAVGSTWWEPTSWMPSH